jgi:N-glycosylase/DNA lyase
VNELKKIYLLNKKTIEKRLNEFNKIWKNASDEKLFEELCYCLCTSREKAKNALNAIENLKAINYFTQGNENAVMKAVKSGGIALYPQKTKNIIMAREKYFPDTRNKLSAAFFTDGDIIKTRAKLAEEISGIGFKEASHFLRNIGRGQSTCILDTHVLNQLVEYGLINAKPKTLTKTGYLEIERIMIKFAKKQGIPIDALDLVFMLVENPEVTK